MNEENTTIMPPEKQIVQDDRDARAEELESAFSYDGYQVVRKELFAHISKDKDAYMQMFLRDYCLRPSCYECTAKKVKMSDLTIADFWGINAVAPDMNDGMGTSLVLIRTDKGKETFTRISDSVKLKEVSYEAGVKENPAEFRSCARPAQRDVFFDDMASLSFEELEKKYAAPIKVSLMTKTKRKVKKTIKKVLRVMGGVKYRHSQEYGLLFVFDCQEKN